MTRGIFQGIGNTNSCLRIVLHKSAVRKIFFVFFIVLFSVPVVTFAALPTLPASIVNLKAIFTGILNIVVFVLIGLAFVVFLWGIYKYVSTASNEGKAGAKETIIYGLVGLFVMLSVWGLVNILLGTFGFTGTTGPVAPTPPKAYRLGT